MKVDLHVCDLYVWDLCDPDDGTCVRDYWMTYAKTSWQSAKWHFAKKGYFGEWSLRLNRYVKGAVYSAKVWKINIPERKTKENSK